METGLSLDTFAREQLERTEAELIQERDLALGGGGGAGGEASAAAAPPAAAPPAGGVPTPLLLGGVAAALFAVSLLARRGK